MCKGNVQVLMKFAYHFPPQTTMKAFKKSDFSVVREHEEFIWLHDHFVGNEELAGFIVSVRASHPLSGNVY